MARGMGSQADYQMPGNEGARKERGDCARPARGQYAKADPNALGNRIRKPRSGSRPTAQGM